MATVIVGIPWAGKAPAWYWCGYARRRGLGWGGSYGWHGWSSPGHRPDANLRSSPTPGQSRLPASREAALAAIARTVGLEVGLESTKLTAQGLATPLPAAAAEVRHVAPILETPPLITRQKRRDSGGRAKWD